MLQHPKVTCLEEDLDPEPEPVQFFSFSDENDDEFIRPENPNKFTYDPENGGGRRHRVHNVSRIAHLRNGEAGIQSCVQNLFGPKTIQAAVSDSEDEVMPFQRITEEKMEESPPTQN